MRWSVRLAVACVCLRYLFRLRDPQPIPARSECWSWAVGLAFYLAHVALAFHIVHDWSHSAAWQHTAQETARVTGINRGEGVWVNYLFTVIWAMDLARIIRANRIRTATSRRVDTVIGGIFLFICVNATAVFGPAHYRPIAVMAGVLAWIVWYRGTRRNAR